MTLSDLLALFQIATTLAVWVGLCVVLSLAITGLAVWLRGRG